MKTRNKRNTRKIQNKRNTHKINKKLRGGHIWTCKPQTGNEEEKCVLTQLQQYSNNTLTMDSDIIDYKDMYNNISKFFTSIASEGIKIYKYTTDIEKISSSINMEYYENCKRCLNYYKKNPSTPIPNVLKLLLSIKLTICTDYIYNKLNYITMFLPLLDNFTNGQKFKDLYFKLKEKKNITFVDIDKLLVIVINIINYFLNPYDTSSSLTFIKLINYILQLFKEILSGVTLTELLLNKFNIDTSLITKLLEFIKKVKPNIQNIVGSIKIAKSNPFATDIKSSTNSFATDIKSSTNPFANNMEKPTQTNPFANVMKTDIKIGKPFDINSHINELLNIENIKKFIGQEIFNQLTLFLKDYNDVMKDDKTKDIIDIQSYIKKKIEKILEEYKFIDFGILPELFKIKSPHNNYNSKISVGGAGKYMKFPTNNNSQPTTTSKNSNSTTTSKNILKDVFGENNSITWSNFRKTLDSDSEIIFDVINNVGNNVGNKYSILNSILFSISISDEFNNDENMKTIFENFNTYMYNPLYGKECVNDASQIENQNNNNIQLLPQNKKTTKKNFSKNTFNGSKSIKGPIKIKHILKFLNGIGLNGICEGLITKSDITTTLGKFNTFFGNILSLNLIVTPEFTHDKIKKTLLLLFLNYIMKNNIDNFFKLQITEFGHLKNKDNILKNTKYNNIKDEDKNKDKELIIIDKNITQFINNKFSEEKLKKYFTLYYIKLMKLLSTIIEENKGEIHTLDSNISEFFSIFLPNHQLNKDTFIKFFKYTAPVSSQFIEIFFSIKIVSGNDGFNYVQYDGNEVFLQAYIQNKKL